MKRLDAFEGVLAVASRGGAGAAVVSWTVFEIRGPRAAPRRDGEDALEGVEALHRPLPGRDSIDGSI